MLTPSNQVDTLSLQHQATSQIDTSGLQAMLTQPSQVNTDSRTSSYVNTIKPSQVGTFGLQVMLTQSSLADTLGLHNFF
jgi:hypothetical protein